jgi:asparagine synthase (glutamine-hydrolysing)
MYRFLACTWDVEHHEAAQQAVAIAARLRASGGVWRTVMDTPGLIVLCIGDDGPTWQTYLLAADSGAVLGMLFQRASDGRSRASASSFDPYESRAIVQTGGEHLVRRYWGRYVAFLRDPLAQRQYILRDPTGLLPCYAARIESVDVYFSWLADAIQAGISATRIDVDYVRAKLQNELAYGRRTGLTDISHVLGGECIAHHRGKIARTLVWNPLHECEPPIEDSMHAAAELRRVTHDVVQAWAGRYKSIIHALSGGLDSSIVLACLHGVPTTVTCLNAFNAGAGDERVIARLGAQRAGCELIEQHRIGAQVRLDSLLPAPPSPEPINHMAWLNHTIDEAPIALERGAGAIFTGQGGDEILARTGATWAVRDYVRRHGIRPALLARAMEAARQEQLSVWKVLRRALSSARWDPQSEMDALTGSNASSPLCVDLGEHPAMRGAPSHLACGKRRHAYLLTPLPPSVWNPVTAPVIERVMPLRSQPLLELCLRIPTYALIEDGWDRALARRAFCSDLPAEVVSRRTKGEISEYALDVLIGNLPFIRDLLLRGRLVKEGFHDRSQLAPLLSIDRARDPGLIARIHDCINIEVWLRSCFAIGARH